VIAPALLCTLLLLGTAQDPAAAATDAQLIERVQTASDAERSDALNSAFARFIDRIDAYELEAAEALILGMHTRELASWSAESLSMLLGRADRFDEARRVLDAQLAREITEEQRRALLKTRALSTLGAGHIDLARREFGAALLHGSSDAAVVLGLIALSEGRLDRARCLSRTQLLREPAPAWALRSWGLSMLPPAGDSPSR
jgi:hypothetical protein